MSYDTVRYSIQRLTNPFLSVIECGLQICHSGHSSGKRIYKEYSAHFILKGKGTYFVNDKVYELSPGQGFMITPDIPNIYIADETEPWEYIYVSFIGADAPTLIHNCGLNDTDVIFSFPMTEEFVNNLKTMHSACRDISPMGYDILGYFLLAMSHLVRQNNQKRTTILPDEYVALACSYMENHMTRDISISDVANYVRIDRSHLYRLFIKHMGISPSDYLLNIRLKRAVSLLECEAALSVSEIALSSGFYDLSHFSKLFTAKYGISPGKYKKQKKDK